MYVDDSVESERDYFPSDDEDGLEDEATGYDDGLADLAEAGAHDEDQASGLPSPSEPREPSH